jgi:hypothetical protein
MVTIRLRWAEQDGNPYPFDATVGPGYVWHCHLLEHEDNEMMRPYIVVSSNQSLTAGITFTVIIAVVIIAVLIALLFQKRFRNRAKK